jgi:hypothetical protein
MQAVFWLMLYLPGGHPVHVGNFPDMASCLAAAESSGSIRVTPSTGASPNTGVLRDFICVQANTGKPSDPGPPIEWPLMNSRLSHPRSKEPSTESSPTPGGTLKLGTLQ